MGLVVADGASGDKGKAIFVMNAGSNDTAITDNSATYDYDGHSSQTGVAYASTSVNPVFVQNNLQYENSNAGSVSGQTAGTNGNDWVNSANFMEIRKGPHVGSISNDEAGEIGNRIYPANTTLSDYAINRDETHSFKVKVYDSNVTQSETNRKFVYSTTSGIDYPSTAKVGLDIDNYDYFILLNPQIVEQGADYLRPHFAKITKIIGFDEFGDGLEFSPAYPTEVSINTKFEIYKGPAKTATDIVAVSYGLRGDASASTDKHDRVNICSRPTWYFYNDRLDEDDQLDYMTKYTATHLRWWNYATTISITDVATHAQYLVGSGSAQFVCASTTDHDKLTEGQSIFANDNTYLGNIQSKDVTGGGSHTFYLDFARVGITQISSTATDFKIGKTIQNVVFRTEAKFNNTIPNIGTEQLDATLVDSVKSSDTNTDMYRWQTGFPKMHRHTGNSKTTTPNSADGSLTGPSKYITFELANFKNNKVAMVTDGILNNPKNKMSQMAQITSIDNSGLQHLKVREEDKLIIQSHIHSDTLTKKKSIGKVSRHSSQTDKFELKDIKQETDLRHVIHTNDLVEIDGYLYAVNAVSAPSGGIQAFTVKDKKLINATTWSGSSTAENITLKDMYVMPYTTPLDKDNTEIGVINTTLSPDTEIDYASNRVSMNGTTIEKETAKLYDSRLVIGNFNSHDNRVDSGDKDNQVLRLQDPKRVFYQRSNEAAGRFYYYQGSYAISDTTFTGTVEDIDSKAAQGMTTFRFTGRDDTSKLLSRTVSKDTSFKKDVVHSTITPTVSDGVLIANISSVQFPTAVADLDTLTFSGTPSVTPERYGLILNSGGELIGEVKTYSSGTITFYDDRLISSTTSNQLYYWHPYKKSGALGDIYQKFITGTKALASNELHTGDSLNGFVSISEKSFGFNNGRRLSGQFANASAAITTSELKGTSNTGNYLEDKTLGYDISSPKAIDVNDSVFAFKVSNENGATIDTYNLATPAKELVDVVNVTEKTEGTTTVSVAPMFPIVLGRLDTNTSDNRGNIFAYLVNSNIDVGGFLHRLADYQNGTGYLHSTDVIRYWDFQKFQPGTLTRSVKSIYKEGKTPQKIQGYVVGYKADADGVKNNTVSSSPAITPIMGSNTMNNYAAKDAFYGTQAVLQSYPSHFTGSGASENEMPQDEVGIDWDVFEQIDPRVGGYELLATGDLFPYSHRRHNNLGFTNSEFHDFGVLLQSDSSVTSNTNHQHYDGATKQTKLSESMFEEAEIKEATINTNGMRRWGVIRLVEATFDWHFNPVDFDALKPSHEIPTVRYFDYMMFTQPTDVANIVISTQLERDSGMTEAATSVGDMFYETDRMGAYDYFGLLPEVPTASNGFGTARIYRAAGLGSEVGQGWTLGVRAQLNYEGTGGAFTPAVRYDGYSNGSNVYWRGVEPFKIYRTTDYNIENLNSKDIGQRLAAEQASGSKNIRWTDVFIARPNINNTNFHYGLLEDDDTTVTDFDPHNIIIPIITEEKSGATNRTDRTFSPYHNTFAWAEAVGAANSSGVVEMLHMSRVIAGLMDRNFSGQTFSSSTTAMNMRTKYGVGISAATNSVVGHPYRNCIGIFKDVRDTAGNILYPLMSAPLQLDTDTNYAAYLTDYSSETDHDQHTRNTMIQTYGSDNIVMSGTKTEAHFLQDASSDDMDAITASTTRYHDHNSVSATVNGSAAHSAQMLIKPRLYLPTSSSSYITKTTTRKTNDTFEFKLASADTDIIPMWMSYVPDLTGYYLVSEKLSQTVTLTTTGGIGGDSISVSETYAANISTKNRVGSPLYISKILSHTKTNPTTSDNGYEKHKLVFDIPPDPSTHGTGYRIMRISETTFDKTPDKIEFNVLKDSGLQYNTIASNFKTGAEGGDDGDMLYHEGVYAMHLLLELDNSDNTNNAVEYLEKRTGTQAIATFTDGEVIDMWVTDGHNSSRKKVTVSTTKPLIEEGSEDTQLVENILSFSFGGELTGNGVVSFSEVFDIALSRRPKLKNIKKAHIGTTFNISSALEKEIENLVKDSGLKYNAAKSFSIPTGTLVNNGAYSSVNIQCTTAAKDIAVNDLIYNQEGHFIGKVAALLSSNTIIQVTEKFYVPSAYDELYKINKKTFVTNLKFDDLNLYDAINALVVKKGLDYNIKNGEFVTRNIDDTTSLRKFALSYQESGRLISVSSNKSLFDKANKVVVVGDRIKYELQKETTKEQRTVTVVDPTIKTETDAQVRAVELLDMYSDDVRKITLKLQKEGLEMLEAGDVVRLNFPNHNIPLADYIVFEIENVLAGTLVITVGTFSKSIAERLTEISSQSSQSSTTQFKKDAIEISAGKFLFDTIKLKEIGVSYEITGPSNALSYNSNMGFDDLVGFTEEVGFEHSTVTKKSYGGDFYEQEDYR